MIMIKICILAVLVGIVIAGLVLLIKYYREMDCTSNYDKYRQAELRGEKRDWKWKRMKGKWILYE